jgi:hypothetical protein
LLQILEEHILNLPT